MSNSPKNDKLTKTAALVLQRLKRYEFGTFEVRADTATKEAISIAIANLLDTRQATEKPDITIKISKKSEIELTVHPLFLEGSFRILSDTVVPSEKECAACKGSGCPKCDYAGTTSGETAEKLISEALLPLTGGVGYSFKQKGLERGRYLFSITIDVPRKRTLDIAAIILKLNNGKKIFLETLDYSQ